MDKELLSKLEVMKHENATIYALLEWWHAQNPPFEVWAKVAIIKLAEANTRLFAIALDAEKRAYPKPLIIPRP